MKVSRALRQSWFLWILVLVIAGGCGTKQTVKSSDSATTPQEQAAGGTTGSQAAQQPTGRAQESIATETVKPAETSGGGAAGAPGGMQVAKAGVAEAGVAATEEKSSGLDDIHFDFDKASIRDDAKPVLAKVAAAVKNGKAGRLTVEGHCDERGTAEYNMALGERRAESARAYLVSLGVAKDRLATVSFGKEKPLDPEHNESAWAKNRRAHFVVK